MYSALNTKNNKVFCPFLLLTLCIIVLRLSPQHQGGGWPLGMPGPSSSKYLQAGGMDILAAHQMVAAAEAEQEDMTRNVQRVKTAADTLVQWANINLRSSVRGLSWRWRTLCHSNGEEGRDPCLERCPEMRL